MSLKRFLAVIKLWDKVLIFIAIDIHLIELEADNHEVIIESSRSNVFIIKN
jgi:hypothetical protein